MNGYEKVHILEKATQRAVSRGWWYAGNNKKATLEFEVDDFGNNLRAHIDYKMGDGRERMSIKDIIFDLSFARALWGEEMQTWRQYQSGAFYGIKGAYCNAYLPLYMLHLQEMVMDTDPIKYLGDSLDN